jgi:cellulose synthase/poly-beta-1,6-N-acetylglucosamine synthase-like glycosyltransferase
LNIVIFILASLIILYLFYPLWLMMQSKQQPDKIKDYDLISKVSLIYLSYNGKDFLENKIKFLLNELTAFNQYELIIVDDNSTDESQEVINKFTDNINIRIIFKSEQKGIPHSMNIGVREAKYEYIVFCDQRQSLSKNIISQLIAPFKYKKVGAVSAFISQRDNKNCFSLIRAHENFIKSQEGKSGNLIGVYGPLYAIKRECYSQIPDHIILDDLYLTLKILRSKQVLLIKECQIIEENEDFLYNYGRTKRYLQGLLQLTREKELISQLSYKQILMLFWHKYLRLFIPLILFIGYIKIGILSVGSFKHLIAFLVITVIGIFSILSGVLKIKFRLQNFIKINILYLFAFCELAYLALFNKKRISVTTKYRL